MKENISKKLTRQFNTAIEKINTLSENYHPEDAQDIGEIAKQIVLIYEIVKTGNIDKLNYQKTKDKSVPQLRSYFLDHGIFEKDICLVLKNKDDHRKHYGYTRLKLLKFVRGESVHGGSIDRKNDSLRVLKNFYYEENLHYIPIFAIRRDFLQFPNVVFLGESDTKSPFQESIKLKNGNIHNLTTIESIVFSVYYEMGSMSRNGVMGWDKSYMFFEVKRFKELVRKDLWDNLTKQSKEWSSWNKFPIEIE